MKGSPFFVVFRCDRKANHLRAPRGFDDTALTEDYSESFRPIMPFQEIFPEHFTFGRMFLSIGPIGMLAFLSLACLLLWQIIRRLRGICAGGSIFDLTDAAILIAALAIPLLSALSTLPISNEIYLQGVDSSAALTHSLYNVAWLAFITWWGVVAAGSLGGIQFLLQLFRKQLQDKVRS